MQTPEHQPHRHGFVTDTTLFRTTALATVIAAFAALTAVMLLNLIRFFTNLFFFQTLSLAGRSPATNTLSTWVIAVPLIGGLIVGLVTRFDSGKIHGHGTPEATEAILFGKSRMSPRVAVLEPLSSGIVIGSGSPFGTEGPIVITGGAIGSLFTRFFRPAAAEHKTLLVAGATAGMTAVFGTPVAVLLLAVELLLFEWHPRSMLPVAVACVMAGFLRVLVLESGPLFLLDTAPATLSVLDSCVITGLLCGTLTRSLSMTLYKTEDLPNRLPIHWMWWPAFGNLVVGINGYLEPRALGVGYDVIGGLLHNRLAIRVALALLVIKAIIQVIALNSDTSGRVFAPLLMMDTGLGVLISPMLPGGDPGLRPPVCMAAILAGVLGAPLTVIVFVFSLTHGASTLLPILLAVAVSYGSIVLTVLRSTMTGKIARRSFRVYHEYAVNPLKRHAVEETTTRSVQTIDAQATLADTFTDRFGATWAHRAFPVVQDGPNGTLIGMLDRDALLADQKRGAVTVAELFGANAPVVTPPGETCRIVATRLAVHGLERLPVVAGSQSHALVGIVSRGDLVKPSLAFFNEEQRRERFHHVPLSGARTHLELRRRCADRVVW